MLSASSLLCAVLFLTGNPCDPVHTLDQVTKSVHNEMAGEHWYAVRFQDRTIGSLRESRANSSSGEYVLNRSLRFSLMRHRVTHVNERIVFSSKFPYPLLEADQETTVTHLGHRSASRRSLPVVATSDTQRSELSYLDSVAFHPRLIANRDRIETRSIDFVNARSSTNVWWVSRTNRNGSNLTLTSDDGSTSHVVSSRGIPSHTHMSGRISMSALDGPLDQPWRDDEYVFETGDISVPVNEVIADHHRLITLTLRLHAEEVTKKLWEPIADRDGYIKIDRRSLDPRNEHHSETTFPRVERPTNSSVTQLIRELEIDRSATYGNVARLVHSLHEQIEYEDIPYSSPVDETLHRKTGDCTEFADIVEAVATVLGWDSRIKTGLAYHSPSQTFRPHAWNEIAIDEHWISADASWGQFPADASHVPFPRENTLALLAQASSMRFEVVDHQYSVD
ncbi:MAG: transglutaminase domain-containing protein [Gammaproteobacteria bacterium]|nr:transglutaminase domain-containing protein [Gammaproteobacteria bacterium]